MVRCYSLLYALLVTGSNRLVYVVATVQKRIKLSPILHTKGRSVFVRHTSLSLLNRISNLRMRFLLKLFLVSIFGSATVSSLLSGKIKFNAKSTLPKCRIRLHVSTLSVDFVGVNKNYPRSDSTWLQVFAEEKKITPAAFSNVLNVNAWRTVFEEEQSTTAVSARKSVGPMYLESIEGSWRQMRNSGMRRVIKNTIQKVLMFCTIAASMLVIGSQQAFAAVAPLSKNVKGWDLFGRVPHDDWLFTNRALTDRNILKRSFLESVVTELPDVLNNFRRRKRVNEFWVLGSGVGYCFLAVGIAAIAYKGAMESNLRRLEREDNRNGLARKGYGAIAKKGTRKGVDIDGMDGWIDMENQDTDDKNKKDDDDDDEEEDV